MSAACAPPVAFCRISVGGRIPTIAASKASTSFPTPASSASDHPGRAYLALSVFYRHQGLVEDALGPRIRELAHTRLKERARLLGGALRLASVLSASVAGILPRIGLEVEDGQMTIVLPGELAALEGERLAKRANQFGRLLGLKARIEARP